MFHIPIKLYTYERDNINYQTYDCRDVRIPLYSLPASTNIYKKITHIHTQAHSLLNDTYKNFHLENLFILVCVGGGIPTTYIYTCIRKCVWMIYLLVCVSVCMCMWCVCELINVLDFGILCS